MEDRIIVTAFRPDRAIIELDAKTGDLIAAHPLPWKDSLPRGTIITRHNARGPGPRDWVSAFFIGPGFFVYRDGVPTFYAYADSVPFRSARPPMEGDSARFAAHWIDVVENELYILFGGRPGSPLQAHEFPRRIDVYSMNGLLVRSYLLPTWTTGFALHGPLFAIPQNDPYPAILLIRPAGT